MQPRALDTYGAPYADEYPAENPQTQLAANYGNRFLEDLAQLTRTAYRAVVVFNTVANAPVYVLPASSVSIRTLWGTGTSYKPAVRKTETGLYDVIFSASYADGLGVPELLGFFDGFAVGRGATVTDVPSAKLLTLSANIVTVATMSAGVLADTLASTAAITTSVYIL